MSLFLALLNAKTFEELPVLARDAFAGFEEQIEKEFINAPKFTSKQNLLLSVLDDCMQHEITSDRGYFLCWRYSMLDTDEDFDDHLEEMRTASDPAESVQSVSVPTFSEPHRSVSEVSAPVDKETLKEALSEFFTPKVVSRTGRQVKNDPKNAKHRCGLCGLCMSSHGALFNHSKSSGHKAAVLAAIGKARTLIAENTARIPLVTYRNKAKEARPAIKAAPGEKWIDALERYVNDDYSNPILSLDLHEHTKVWSEKLGDYRYETKEIPL